MKRKVFGVKQLARWIAAELLPDEDGNTCLRLDREWTLDPSRGLRQKTVEELATLHDRLSRAIPDDFDFSLEFEDGEVFATLEYSDGPHAGFGGGFPVPVDRNMLGALREYDWDALRAQLIQGTQFHDNAADLAENYPSKLESTTIIQARHTATIEQFRNDPKLADSPYALLFGNEWEDEEEDEIEARESSPVEYEVETYTDREKLLGQMANLLTFGYTMVAILRDGKLLTPEESDELRQEALEGLGPISRAKAEGRFEAAVAAMMQNQF